MYLLFGLFVVGVRIMGTWCITFLMRICCVIVLLMSMCVCIVGMCWMRVCRKRLTSVMCNVMQTVTDVLSVRRAKKRIEPVYRPYADYKWDPVPTGDFPHRLKGLFLFGPSGTGKSQWAKHYFKCPLEIYNRNGLKDFVDGFHDGIVWNEPVRDDRDALSREEWIALLDGNTDCQIRVLFGLAKIDRRVPKIFTSNKCFLETFPAIDDGGSIRRRLFEVFIPRDCPLYRIDEIAEHERPKVYANMLEQNVPDCVFRRFPVAPGLDQEEEGSTGLCDSLSVASDEIC